MPMLFRGEGWGQRRPVFGFQCGICLQNDDALDDMRQLGPCPNLIVSSVDLRSLLEA